MPVKDLQILINGVDYELPENWRQLSMTYTLDDSILLQQDFPGRMSYCGKEPFTDLQDQINESKCGEIDIEVNAECPPLLPTLDQLYAGQSKLTEAEFTCGNPCGVSIQSTNENAYTILEENSGEDICVDCEDYVVAPDTDQIRVRQIQSGGEHILPDGSTVFDTCFLRLKELISAMVDELNYTLGDGIPNEPFDDTTNSEFLHEINRIIIPNTNDAQIDVSIISEWGTTHTITLNLIGGETLADRADLLSKAILARDYNHGPTSGIFNPPMYEMFHYISAVRSDLTNDMRPANDAAGFVARVAGELDVITDWPVSSITVTGDVNGALTVNQLQEYQYGLGEMMFSVNGMDQASICTTWAELKDFISCIHPTVFIPSNNSQDFTYGGYDNEINNAPLVIAQPALTPRQVSYKLRADIMDNKGLFGQQSILENVTESNDLWQWYGTNYSLVASQIGPNVQFAGTPVYRAIPAVVTGKGSFSGSLIFVNNDPTTTATIFVSLWPNNTSTPPFTIGEDLAITLLPNQTKNVDLFLENVLDGSEACLQSGVTYYFRYRIQVSHPVPIVVASTATGVDDATLALSIASFDEDYPLISDENSFRDEDPYYEFIDFADCTGIRDCGLSEKFYTGVGYGFTQQITGSNDYEDTVFVSFQSPLNANDGTINNGTDQTWMFERQFYFDASAVDACYQERIISYFYHNLPIQHPWIAYEWRNFIPSDFSYDIFQITNVVDSNGSGNEPTIDSSTVNLLANSGTVTKGHNRIFLYEFDDCIDLLGFFLRVQNRKLDFTFCDKGDVNGVIRQMSASLDGHEMQRFVIESEQHYV